MSKGVGVLCISVLATFAALGFSSTEARALTVKECSTKYKAAKAAKTLGAKTWNEFRKSDCGSTATAPSAAKATKPKTLVQPSVGSAVFPAAISPKYANERPGRARMHTCRDQYRANKATNSNAGLKWIMKGGGYYSECNKRLKV